MRRTLFILFLLLGAPAHAVAIPGVTTDASGSQEAAPAAEPDVEQKKKPPTVPLPMCLKTIPPGRS